MSYKIIGLIEFLLFSCHFFKCIITNSNTWIFTHFKTENTTINRNLKLGFITRPNANISFELWLWQHKCRITTATRWTVHCDQMINLAFMSPFSPKKCANCFTDIFVIHNCRKQSGHNFEKCTLGFYLRILACLWCHIRGGIVLTSSLGDKVRRVSIKYDT